MFDFGIEELIWSVSNLLLPLLTVDSHLGQKDNASLQHDPWCKKAFSRKEVSFTVSLEALLFYLESRYTES